MTADNTKAAFAATCLAVANDEQVRFLYRQTERRWPPELMPYIVRHIPGAVCLLLDRFAWGRLLTSALGNVVYNKWPSRRAFASSGGYILNLHSRYSSR